MRDCKQRIGRCIQSVRRFQLENVFVVHATPDDFPGRLKTAPDVMMRRSFAVVSRFVAKLVEPFDVVSEQQTGDIFLGLNWVWYEVTHAAVLVDGRAFTGFFVNAALAIGSAFHADLAVFPHFELACDVSRAVRAVDFGVGVHLGRKVDKQFEKTRKQN